MEWHYLPLSEAQFKMAIAEISSLTEIELK